METKKLYNMNYLKGLHPKGSNELRMRTTKNGLRGLMLRSVALLLLLLGTVIAHGQNYYVFRNSTYGYIAVSNTNTPALSTTFTPGCVWVASGEMGTTSRTVNSYTDNAKYLRGGTNNTPLTTGGSNGNAATRWQLRGTNYLNSYNTTYVKWSNNALTCLNTNNVIDSLHIPLKSLHMMR